MHVTLDKRLAEDRGQDFIKWQTRADNSRGNPSEYVTEYEKYKAFKHAERLRNQQAAV